MPPEHIVVAFFEPAKHSGRALDVRQDKVTTPLGRLGRGTAPFSPVPRGLQFSQAHDRSGIIRAWRGLRRFGIDRGVGQQPLAAVLGAGGDIIISPEVRHDLDADDLPLLIFQRRPDRSLDLISPWLEMQTHDISDVIADLEAQQHRRFIKSHTPLDGLPYEPAITHLRWTRPPRCAISWAHHQDNLNLEALFTARDRRRERGPRRDVSRLGTRRPIRSRASGAGSTTRHKAS